MEHMMNYGKEDYGTLGRDRVEAAAVKWKPMSMTQPEEEQENMSKGNKNEVQEEKYEKYSHESKGKTYQELSKDERRKFKDEMMQRVAVDKQALWDLREGERQVRRNNQRRKKKNNKKKAEAKAKHKNQNPNNLDHIHIP